VYGSGWVTTPCRHKDGTLIFTVPLQERTLRIYAGSYRGAYEHPYDLILDLADMLMPIVQGHHLDPSLEAWTKSLPDTSILKLAWADQQIPPLGRDDWLNLTKSLLASSYENMYVCCFGGHGRTGTCLAILGCLLTELGHPGIPQQAEPITWVRRHYCQDAVETSWQAHYIAYVTDRDEALEAFYHPGLLIETR
jgi:hypothetical protein